ncbi:DUF4268 domain-containing protein [Sphingobium sp.]|jgi:hypothetical protein|uniref:DUF4268 domain-containing protein n=1 Tax=Sphingobium sp. TaxID=1912891 RepID=UPI003BB768D0
MSNELERYLSVFTAKATEAGLPVRNTGSNWCPLAPLTKGSHVSLSVAKNQIQVNLNNEDDADRSKFEGLHADRDTVETEVGEGLTWEKKDGRKKTAVRATFDAGYEAPVSTWSAQHDWAIAMMQRFQASFGSRLA